MKLILIAALAAGLTLISTTVIADTMEICTEFNNVVADGKDFDPDGKLFETCLEEDPSGIQSAIRYRALQSCGTECLDAVMEVEAILAGVN